MEKTTKTDFKEIISNFTSLDYVVLACMHHTDLKTMIRINPLDLVISCEKFFDCKFMEKMNHEPPVELRIKIQKWLDSVEYKQYTKKTNQTLSIVEKEKIRNIYLKLGLKPHDLSELTSAGKQFLENIENKVKSQWSILLELSKSNDAVNLKKSIDEFDVSIPLMFTTGIAKGKSFIKMFETMDVGMYEYLSKNPAIDPIFLDYLS